MFIFASRKYIDRAMHRSLAGLRRKMITISQKFTQVKEKESCGDVRDKNHRLGVLSLLLWTTCNSKCDETCLPHSGSIAF